MTGSFSVLEPAKVPNDMKKKETTRFKNFKRVWDGMETVR